MLKNKLRQLWIKSLFFSPFVYKTKKKVTAILTTCYQKRLLKQKSLIKCFLAIWILFVFCFLLIVNTFHHVHFHSSYQQKNYYNQCKETCSPLPKPGKCTTTSFFPQELKIHLPVRSIEVFLQQAQVVHDNRLLHFKLHQTIDLLSPGFPFKQFFLN